MEIIPFTSFTYSPLDKVTLGQKVLPLFLLFFNNKNLREKKRNDIIMYILVQQVDPLARSLANEELS